MPRDGFSAEVACGHRHGTAEGRATAALTLAGLDAAQAGAQQNERVDPAVRSRIPEDPLRVGHASSTVTVTRKAGQGVTVTVDSMVTFAAAKSAELVG